MRHDGRVIVVTGASSGVGRATAREFAARGASVALLARGQDGLDGAAKDVEAQGGRALPIALDVGIADQVEAAASRAEDELGPIDVWVNAAMTTVFAPFSKIRAEEFARVTETDYLGYVYGTMAALRMMRPRDRGVIVQVGSALAFRSIPLQSAYCGAKHAIAGFTSSVRTELLHDRSGVRITQVHLPAVNTPQFDHCLTRMPNEPQPVPPIYQPEIPARAIVWAAEHPRREHWVGATTVATILANRIVPGLLDRYLARTNYGAQQTDRRLDPDRRDNLWEPLPGDPGAHGDFDARSVRRSPQVWASERRGPLAATGAALVVGTTLAAAAASERLGRRRS
jgi:NAD(P)-dependent dehydrogenase (short-subunit alcohol dehydrogenase family)